jgi:putative chitinase
MIKLYGKYRTLLTKNGIDTPIRLAHFFAQIDHESGGGKRLVENLNYSKERLLKIFMSDFDTNKDRKLSENEIKVAEMLARKPEQIANFVYARQNGNGNVNSGDGWRYRGRGYIQITGRYNYSELSKDTGIDFVSKPELLEQEANAIVSAIWFWNDKDINKLADNDDIVKVTRTINGGLNGIEHRKELLDRYKRHFGAA